MAEELTALADRCGEAAGPDRALDEAIAKLFHDESWAAWRMGVATHGETAWVRFTASLDAAMLLVPEGYGRRMGGGASGDQWCEVMPPSRRGIAAEYYASAATLPLALCAAALKAHAEIQRLRKQGE